ncbi:MAG: hypothetical protein HYT15_03780 [Candidatus Magasanikbacteria bacterium]|nr:hypothetical protein [Candidatus Magasanikbacteria bacterium]
MLGDVLYFKEVIVGAVVICNILITYAVYVSNKKSATNRVFLLLGLVISFWLLAMYLSVNPQVNLFWTRQSAFWATFMSFLLFLLAYVLPGERFLLSKKNLFYTVAPTIFITALTFTPYVFEKITISAAGSKVAVGFGIIPFSLLTTFFSVFAVYLLLKKLHKSSQVERRQLGLVLTGFFLMLGLIIFTILIPVIFLRDNFFVQFAPVYVFFFLAATAIAIIKYHLFNIKVIATEVLVLILIMVLLIEGALSGSIFTVIFKVSFAILVGIIGILLVRSVQKEIKQKDELSNLAASLEKANTRLQELDKQKTEFLTIASHQLRTPLSILKGYIELIKDGSYGKIEPATAKVLDDMDLNNEHLVKLVDTLLDITRIEQGRTKYSFAMNNICALIDESVSDLKLKAKEKKMKLVWTCPKKMTDVCCDQEKMHHVIYNFIDNALKYSEKGSVKVTLKEEGGGIAMKVVDNGIGFNKVDENNFFHKFYRGDNVRTIGISGTGLGLYVCRKFVEAHSGRVWAHSEGLGKGSEFGFWIPVKPPAPAG